MEFTDPAVKRCYDLLTKAQEDIGDIEIPEDYRDALYEAMELPLELLSQIAQEMENDELLSKDDYYFFNRSLKEWRKF